MKNKNKLAFLLEGPVEKPTFSASPSGEHWHGVPRAVDGLKIPEIRYILVNYDKRERDIILRHIERHMRAMRADKWVFGPILLVFGPQMELLDGRNCLYAALLANRPLDCWVWGGVPEAACERM